MDSDTSTPAAAPPDPAASGIDPGIIPAGLFAGGAPPSADPRAIAPGKHTTEWWITKVVVLCALGVAATGTVTTVLQTANVIPGADRYTAPVLAGVGLAAGALKAFGYSVNRLRLKAKQLDAMTPAEIQTELDKS